MGYTKDDIRRLCRENDVKFIRLQFTDILGTLKNVAITYKQLDKALDNKCMFDGSSIEGFVRIEESDMSLRPDLDSFVIYPWQQNGGRVARLICDIFLPDGSPFQGSPRYALERAVERAAAMGYTLNIGPELEFFLFSLDEKGEPTLIPHDNGGYFDLGPTDMGENTRREICLLLEDMGFEIEASHHECAHGQHEIDFKYTDAVRAADNIMTFKLVVKTVAQQNGLFASFLPKPLADLAGNGMHTNVSLSKDGVNAFFDPEGENQLSETAYQFMAGVLAHMRGMTAVTNPLVNSYKRLVPGYEAPVYIAWSKSNRSPLIRIPAARGQSTRMELRCPDPACNPYLELAVMLHAGLDGIEKKMQAPPSIDRNLFVMTENERKDLGVEKLPATLGEAIAEMENDPLMREALGDHIFDKYMEAKKHEWADYQRSVSQWEIDRYLKLY